MKKALLLFIGSISFFFVSCEGEFKPFDVDGQVRLLFPENEKICPEGVAINDDLINIPLNWSADGNFDSYRIIVNDRLGNSLGQLTTKGLDTTINLGRGMLYTWKVIGIRGGEQIDSEQWSFYSEGDPSGSSVPYPANISHTVSNGLVTISWNATDEDNDIENYNVYLSTTNPANTLISEKTKQTSTTETLTLGLRYYVRVLSYDKSGNYSIADYDFVI